MPDLFTTVERSDNDFLYPPERQWIHPDNALTDQSGVVYSVRYLGCVDVYTSMKNMDYHTRFDISRECIHQVCVTAGMKTIDRKRKISKKIIHAIGSRPNMKSAGINVNLFISTKGLIMKSLDNGRTIVRHDIPRISFTSGGDAETMDFISYVAKDMNNWRACFVLECGGGVAQEVINTIGQAFDLRFKQFLTKNDLSHRLSPHDREYYNDMPGKIPPDVTLPPTLDCISQSNSSGDEIVLGQQRERLPSTNLIDFNCEVEASSSTLAPCQSRIHNGENDINGDENSDYEQPYQPSTSSSFPFIRDVFDMQPFVSDYAEVPSSSASSSVSSQIQVSPKCEISLASKLNNEFWFHGNISRQQAEILIKQDGDFLVRESQGSSGQYVLSGMQDGVKKHLLLISPEGLVRTRDRIFESVSHLIQYYFQNKLPIVSSESTLTLRRPLEAKIN